jgi:hypothetical protein
LAGAGYFSSPKRPDGLWKPPNLVVCVHQGKCNGCFQLTSYLQYQDQECVELYHHFLHTFMACAGTALPLRKKTPISLCNILRVVGFLSYLRRFFIWAPPSMLYTAKYQTEEYQIKLALIIAIWLGIQFSKKPVTMFRSGGGEDKTNPSHDGKTRVIY